MDRMAWIVVGIAAFIIIALVGFLLLIVAGAAIWLFVLQPAGTDVAPTPAGTAVVSGGAMAPIAGTGSSGSTTAATGTSTGSGTGTTNTTNTTTTTAPPEPEPEPEPEITLKMIDDFEINKISTMCNGGEVIIRTVTLEGKGDFAYDGKLTIKAATSGTSNEETFNKKFSLKKDSTELINLAVDASVISVGGASSVSVAVILEDGRYAEDTFSVDC
ncbi:MAG: hypothetical protein ABH854_03835 [Candidatus Diapherotrites archaeon]|nr:hypothetical protein [Candidatus Micrarchaeota archaeon]MBU1939289.1 hypothetical protein [Candidatus Micrarchaeota archaeon]